MWSYIITILSIFAFLLNGYVFGVTVTPQQAELTVNEGSAVNFTYTYTLAPGEAVAFVKFVIGTQSIYLSTTGFAGDFGDRFSTTYGAGVNPITFSLRQALRNDEADYTLDVTSTGISAAATVKLIVNYAPTQPTITGTPATVVGGAGATQIVCPSTDAGKPRGLLKWHQKTKANPTYVEVDSANYTTTDTTGNGVTSTLTVNLDIAHDESTFKCVISNDAGTVQEESSAIKVEAPVPVSKDNIQLCKTGNNQCSLIEVFIGDDVSLTCGRVSSATQPLPLPTYKWLQDGVESGTSNKKLTITAKNDVTNISCEATNVVRGVTHTVTKSLLVRAAARPTTTPGTTTTSGKATTTTPVAKDNTSVPTVPAGIGAGAIAGIVVGAVVVIVVVILIIFFCKRSKNRNGKDQKRVLDAEDRVDHGQKNNGMEGDDSHNTQPDVVASDQLYAQVNKPRAGQLDDPRRNKNVEGLQYAELAFDNKPRSRNPIQAYELGGTEYAEIMRA